MMSDEALRIWHSSLLTPDYLTGIDIHTPPRFDLNLVGFPKEEITKYGLKEKVTFYDNYADGEYQTPLCVVNWATNFKDGVPVDQTRIVRFYKENNTLTEAQTSTQPIRNPKVFLQKMRTRVIEELIDLADKFGLGTQIKALYEQHSSLIYIYKEGGSPKFREAIKEADEAWLNAASTTGGTIRDVLMQYLSIGTLEDAN